MQPLLTSLTAFLSQLFPKAAPLTVARVSAQLGLCCRFLAGGHCMDVNAMSPHGAHKLVVIPFCLSLSSGTQRYLHLCRVLPQDQVHSDAETAARQDGPCRQDLPCCQALPSHQGGICTQEVCRGRILEPPVHRPPPLYLHPSLNSADFLLQNLVRVRESNFCAICEFVMKELESRLEDQTTEVGHVLVGPGPLVLPSLAQHSRPIHRHLSRFRRR